MQLDTLFKVWFVLHLIKEKITYTYDISGFVENHFPITFADIALKRKRAKKLKTQEEEGIDVQQVMDQVSDDDDIQILPPPPTTMMSKPVLEEDWEDNKIVSLNVNFQII